MSDLTIRTQNRSMGTAGVTGHLCINCWKGFKAQPWNAIYQKKIVPKNAADAKPSLDTLVGHAKGVGAVIEKSPSKKYFKTKPSPPGQKKESQKVKNPKKVKNPMKGRKSYEKLEILLKVKKNYQV